MTFNFSYTSTVLATIAVAVGILKLKYLTKQENLILIIITCVIITDLFCINFTKPDENTSVYYNLLVPIQMLLSLIIYYRYLHSANLKKFILFSIILLGILSILNGLFIQDFFKEFASYTFILGGFMVFIFSYLVWWQQVGKLEIVVSNTVLWFAAANFFYYGLVIPAVSANNWLISNSSDLAFPLHTINLIVYGIWASLIGLGFIFKKRQWI